jgi:AraC family transcriptional regulator of adaptative response/methylated-DNA-[protein]-cysteine methyltransferase
MNPYDTIEKAIHFIRANLDSQPNLDEISVNVGLSPFHFQRMFTEWAGVSPKKFLQFLTLENGKKLLKDSNNTLLDVSIDLGLSGTSRLHDLFVSLEAMTPGEYKQKGNNLLIKYRFAESLFGRIFIATTEKGICSIQFSKDINESLINLKKEFSNATFQEGSNENLEKAIHYLTNPMISLSNIKLHVKGTGFQLKVWEALLKIPFGQISTYGELAGSIQNSKASRAVGSALAKNPIAYLIPCHRVIQSTGKIGEYHWNSDRKTAMLGWERIRR